LSIDTNPLSRIVTEIMHYLLHKHIPIISALDTILGVLGEHWGYTIFSKAP